LEKRALLLRGLEGLGGDGDKAVDLDGDAGYRVGLAVGLDGDLGGILGLDEGGLEARGLYVPLALLGAHLVGTLGGSDELAVAAVLGDAVPVGADDTSVDDGYKRRGLVAGVVEGGGDGVEPAVLAVRSLGYRLAGQSGLEEGEEALGREGGAADGVGAGGVLGGYDVLLDGGGLLVPFLAELGRLYHAVAAGGGNGLLVGYAEAVNAVPGDGDDLAARDLYDDLVLPSAGLERGFLGEIEAVL